MVSTLLTMLVACGPSDADIDARITERLVAEKLIEAEVQPPSPTAPRPIATPTPDPVAATHAFLASLDALMKDYEPDLPAIDDDTDVLRCVTTAELKGNPRLKEAGRTLEKEKQASARSHRDALATFKKERLPLEYRLDAAWAERTTKARDQYACFSRNSDGTGDRTRTIDCDTLDCCSVMRGWWTVSVVGETSSTYRGGAPELMARLDSAGLTIPERVSCRVADVVPEHDHRTVVCDGGPNIRTYGDPPVAANVGDVVSVPLREVKRDPNGVLWKDVDVGRWVVDADAGSVRVDDAATCPTIDEIIAAGEGQ